MRPRTMIILAIMAGLLAIIALTSRRAERAGERIAAGPIFPQLTREAIAEIRVIEGADTVLLRKDGALWRVVTEGGYPADTLSVSRILEKTTLLDRKYLRSNTPEMQPTFEVDDAHGILVRYADASGTELALFRVGKNGSDFRSQYVRPQSGNEVFLIPDYLRSVFDVKRATWRDRTIFTFDREQVARVTFRPEGAPVAVVEKNAEGTFALVSPESSSVKAQSIDSTLRMLSTLRCDAFPASTLSLAEAGLLPPKQRVEVQLSDGAQFGLDVGADAGDPARVYVKRDGDETVFVMSKGRVASLVRKVEDLREPATGSSSGS